MKRLDKIEKLGYIHVCILKGILETGNRVTTKEIGAKLSIFLAHKEYTKRGAYNTFEQKVQDLIDLDIVDKVKDAINLYWIKSEFLDAAKDIVRAYDIFKKEEVKP